MTISLALSPVLHSDFKKLGPKCGKIMKQVAATITAFSQDDIRAIEKNGSAVLNIDGQEVTIDVTDVEIVAEDIPGWVVANQDALTVALDIELTEDLLNEGYAREFVNRIQNYRKDSNMDVSDRITIEVESHPQFDKAFTTFADFNEFIHVGTNRLDAALHGGNGVALSGGTGAHATFRAKEFVRHPGGAATMMSSKIAAEYKHFAFRQMRDVPGSLYFGMIRTHNDQVLIIWNRFHYNHYKGVCDRHGALDKASWATSPTQRCRRRATRA